MAFSTVALALGTALTASAGAHLPAAQTFNPTGAEQSYTVPAGVTEVHIELVGGKGADGMPAPLGAGPGGAGGLGADVQADLPVGSIQTLFVEVAQNGGTGSAFGGGGAPGGGTGGGGGGASDIRTCSTTAPSCAGRADSPSSRLLVAGGGGGGGGGNSFADLAAPSASCAPPPGTPCPGGAGGPAGGAGGPGTGGNAVTQPGTAGTSSANGTGGGAPGGRNGHDGSLGAGGAGGAGDTGGSNPPGGADGGGGGGGLYGGGGGGGVNGNDSGTNFSGAAGGGGGSSFADPSALNQSITGDTSGSPHVTITPVAGLPQAATGGAATTTNAATLQGTASPDALPTSYHFDYGLDNRYGFSSDSVYLGSDDADHAVSARLAGLSSGAPFHYRLVATNSAGTTYGQDQIFRTRQGLVAGIAVAVVRSIPPRAIVPIFTNMSGVARLIAAPLHRRVNYGHGKKVRCGQRQISKNLAPHNSGLILSGLVGGCSYHLQLTMASDGQTASDSALLQVLRVRRPKRHR